MTSMPPDGGPIHVSELVEGAGNKSPDHIMNCMSKLISIADEEGLEAASRLLKGTQVEFLRIQLQCQLEHSTAAEHGSILRLTYVSRPLCQGNIDCHILAVDIAAAAVERNFARGITGALCHDVGWFAQVLEGSTSEVLDLFDKIRRDKRHTDVHVIDWHQSNSRLFGDWGMGFAGETPAGLIRKAQRDRAPCFTASTAPPPSSGVGDLHAALITALMSKSEPGSPNLRSGH